MKCKFCGSKRFIGQQIGYHSIIVDEDGNFCDEVECGDAETPYGPYTCCVCGAVYDELDEEELTDKPSFTDARRSANKMVEQIRALRDESEQVFKMAMAMEQLEHENAFDTDNIFVLAMALHHPKFISMCDDPAFSMDDYREALANNGILNEDELVKIALMGPDEFHCMMLHLAKYQRAKYTNDEETELLYREHVKAMVADWLVDKEKLKRVKKNQQAFEDHEFIWID